MSISRHSVVRDTTPTHRLVTPIERAFDAWYYDNRGRLEIGLDVDLTALRDQLIAASTN